MPQSNFEQRVQKRLASSLRLRHYAMALSAVILVLFIALALADEDSKPYVLIFLLLVIFVGCIPALSLLPGIPSTLASTRSRGHWIKSWCQWVEACHRLGVEHGKDADQVHGRLAFHMMLESLRRPASSVHNRWYASLIEAMRSLASFCSRGALRASRSG